MLEQVYDTIIALIKLGLPQDNKGNSLVYNKPITGWIIGEQAVKANEPYIAITGESSTPKEVAMGTWEIEHKLKLEVGIATGTAESSERNEQEFARLIRNVLLPHRRIWVCMMCPFDGLQILTPAHYSAEHSSVLASYITAAQNKFTSTWNETHSTSAPINSLPASGVAMEAFNELYADITAGNIPNGFPADALTILQAAIAKGLTYIRMLYSVKVGDIKSGNNADNALMKTGEFSITALELIKQPAYGPDNVPTTGWKKRLKL